MFVQRAPEVDDLSRPFWEGCDQRELRLQRCARCRRFIHHPERECPFCGSGETRFEVVDGVGRVDTFTEVHRSFVEEYRGAEPYVVGWIALDAQADLRMFGTIAVGLAQRVSIGAPVRVAYESMSGFGTVPYFVLD